MFGFSGDVDRARTRSVWSPAVRPCSSSTASQDSNGAPSSEHWYSSTSSLLWKPKTTSGPEVRGGVWAISVSGGVVSLAGMTSHSYTSGVMSTAPLAPTARTWRLCGPIARPSIECGEVQSTKSAPSSEHWKSNTGWPVSSISPRNSNIAVVAVVSDSGPSSIDVSGAARSTTVHVALRGRRVDVDGLVDGADLERVLAGREDLDQVRHARKLGRAQDGVAAARAARRRAGTRTRARCRAPGRRCR